MTKTFDRKLPATRNAINIAADLVCTVDTPLACEAAKQLKLMHDALVSITRQNGCECDSYQGYTCLLCTIRSIARRAIAD